MSTVYTLKPVTKKSRSSIVQLYEVQVWDRGRWSIAVGAACSDSCALRLIKYVGDTKPGKHLLARSTSSKPSFNLARRPLAATGLRDAGADRIAITPSHDITVPWIIVGFYRTVSQALASRLAPLQAETVCNQRSSVYAISLAERWSLVVTE